MVESLTRLDSIQRVSDPTHGSIADALADEQAFFQGKLPPSLTAHDHPWVEASTNVDAVLAVTS